MRNFERERLALWCSVLSAVSASSNCDKFSVAEDWANSAVDAFDNYVKQRKEQLKEVSDGTDV